jgi:acyl-ACP thioesterase
VAGVTLWVHLDRQNRQPVPVTEAEIDVYASATGGRRVTARLRHPSAPAGDGGTPWTFRLIECDIADHVNNAAYWGPLEEELLAGPEPERIDVELEYRTPSQAGTVRVIGDGNRRWIVGRDGELHASILIRGGIGG